LEPDKKSRDGRHDYQDGDVTDRWPTFVADLESQPEPEKPQGKKEGKIHDSLRDKFHPAAGKYRRLRAGGHGERFAERRLEKR
jgi:hypothetical protein